MHNIARPKPQAGEQKKYGLITFAHWRGEITGGNETLYIVRWQIPRQRSETPMCQGGNSTQESCGAPAFGDKKSQKHTQRCRTPFRRRPSSGSTLLQNELPQSMGIQLTRVLTKTSDQFSNRDSVVVQRSIRRTALRAHPRAERLPKFGFRNGGLGNAGNPIHSLQMPQEHPRSGKNIDAICTAIAPTMASAEVIAKALKCSFVQSSKGKASAPCPLDDVFR
jgi:hypothetical protein